jgi:hypothetical protein
MNNHRAFISYHHAIDDQAKLQFEKQFGNGVAFTSGSVSDGDINPNLKTDTIRQKIRDEYLRDTSVTIVLIGPKTWQRKHVDWEIGSSLRHTSNNSRSGLIGIVLPSYYQAYFGGKRGTYNKSTIPPRLHDNIERGYASIHEWPSSAQNLNQLIDGAFQRRKTETPNNSRDQFGNNRSTISWSD